MHLDQSIVDYYIMVNSVCSWWFVSLACIWTILFCVILLSLCTNYDFRFSCLCIVVVVVVVVVTV